ncbi:MAG: hypothetical protein RIS43_186, partial [Actinomycetota bacterium]
MKPRKFLRGPFAWILVAILVLMVGSQMVSNANAPKSVDTWEALAAISNSKVS